MFDWLKKKNQNSRIYMLTKEIGWFIDAQPKWRVAKIKVMGSLLMGELFQANPRMFKFFENPYAFDRDEALAVYEMLEHARNANMVQLDNTKAAMKRFGMTLPEFSISHAQDVTRGVEVFMATAGMVINAERADETLAMWRKLIGAKDALPDAYAKIVEVQRLTHEMTGADTSSMIPAPDDAEMMFDYVPAIISAKLSNSSTGG